MAIPLQFLVGSLVFAAVYYSWRAINFAYFRPRKLEMFLRKQGFKGNGFNFLYGDLKEMRQFMMASSRTKPINLEDDIKPRLVGFVAKTINTYGNRCFIWLGPRPLLILNDPELVKEVMNRTEGLGKPTAINPLFKLFVTGLATYHGDKWAKHRKILTPAFHLEKLKLMIPAFKLSCQEVLNKWDESIPSDGSGEIDVWPDLQTITSDAISRTAFGSSYEEGRKIFELQREQAGHIVNAARSSVYIPGSRFLPTKKNRRIKEIAREVKSVIMALIDRRIKAIEAHQAIENDLLAIMLQSNLGEIEQHGNKASFGLTMDDIVEECKLFYLAGQDTTSSLLVWTMILLSRYPEWQDKAREEVLHVFGKKNAPHYEGLNHLKVVTMILYEVLRLYPPISAPGRRVLKEIKVGNVTFPSGVDLSLPTIFLHHNTEIWGAEDPMKFNPERFRDGVSKAHRVPGGIYFPFGYGARTCIGQLFAMLEAKLVLSMILQKFSFQLSPAYAHAPVALVAVQPQLGAQLILHKH